jgi:hypothetical protein
LGTRVAKENFIHEEMKIWLISRNVSRLSVQNFLSLSFKLREEHRLRLFENRVLRRIFGSKRKVVAGGWRRLC